MFTWQTRRVWTRFGLGLGSLLGGLFSGLVLGLVSFFGGRESEISFALMWPYFLTVWLARNLCEVMGQEWPNRLSYCLILATNSLCCGLFGGCLGRIFDGKKSQRLS